MLDDLMGFVMRPRVLIALLVAQAVIGSAIGWTVLELADVSGGQGLLDFEIGYDVARVTEMLGAYGEAGMRLMRRVQMLDLLNPALYGLLGTALVQWLAPGSGWRWWMLGGAGLNYAENAVLALLVRDYPQIDAGLVGLGNLLSLAKHGCLGVAGAGVVFLAFRRFWRGVHS